MRFSARKLAGVTVAVTLATLIPISTASAAGKGSPPPKVHVGALTGPTIGDEGQKEYTLEVTARDPDGIINEITVEWSGANYHSVVYADRFCAMSVMTPGQPVTMRIPVSLPGPGVYRAEAHAHSIASCDTPSDVQTGPAQKHRFSVTH